MKKIGKLLLVTLALSLLLCACGEKRMHLKRRSR